MNGNITACINDGCADPFKEDDDSLSEEEGPKDMPANVDLVEVAIGKWPFVFVVTISEVAAGQLCADLEGWAFTHSKCVHAPVFVEQSSQPQLDFSVAHVVICR